MQRKCKVLASSDTDSVITVTTLSCTRSELRGYLSSDSKERDMALINASMVSTGPLIETAVNNKCQQSQVQDKSLLLVTCTRALHDVSTCGSYYTRVSR